MDKGAFSTSWFGGEKVILPMSSLGGEELDPEEEMRPRKDYGPIGPKKKEEKESAGLIFNWVSDFIGVGGGVESEEVLSLGLAPGMIKPKTPVAPMAPDLKIKTTPGPPGVIGYYPGSTASSSSGYSTSQSMNEYEPPSPPAGVYTQFPPSQHVQYSLLRQQSMAPPPPPPPPQPHVKKLSAKESSNRADIQEFIEQYGNYGKIRPNHFYRPRKGKYFKKFEEK